MESRTTRTDRSALARPAARRRLSTPRGPRRHPHHPTDARPCEHSADAALLERNRRRTQEGGRPAGEPEPFAELPNSTPSLHVSRTIRVGHRHEGRPPRRSRGRRRSRRRVGLLYQARCAREERRYVAARAGDGARISRGAIEPGGTGRAGGAAGVTQITQITESSSSFLSPVICEIPDPLLQGPFGMHR